MPTAVPFLFLLGVHTCPDLSALTNDLDQRSRSQKVVKPAWVLPQIFLCAHLGSSQSVYEYLTNI